MAAFIFIAGALLCLFPFVTAAVALVLGILIAVSVGNPFLSLTKSWTTRLLQISVVGLGFGMNLLVVGKVGINGIGYTVVGIALTFLLGFLLGRLIGVERDVSLLLTVGTAICGGSAIAAVAPVIRAKDYEISISLVTVFLLNAVALIIFPPLGHFFGFTENQFGLWSALAIHDTSSVVGATLQYGPNALEVGTTVKLARALWIAPVAFGIGFLRSRETCAEAKSASGSVKIPWFILGFILAAAIVTWVPALQSFGELAATVAKRLLVLTLFLIGAGLTREALKNVGIKPLVQGVTLWLLVSVATLAAVSFGVIT